MNDDFEDLTKEKRWRKSFRTWWQRIKKPLEISAVAIFLVSLLVLIIFIILGYKYNLDWVGLTSGYSKVTTIKTPQGATITTGQLPAKSLWDWLQLLIIPAVLAVGGYVFNLTVSRNEQKSTQLRDQTEREIAGDNQQEAALQAYIDKMSELLLDKKLRDLAEDDEARKIARVRTLTVLPRLDKDRKKSVLQFLHESGLIHKDKPIIVLDGADLSGANLSDADFSKADFSKANLEGANLGGANLIEANLSKANLIEAKLGYAKLSGSKFGGAYFISANLSKANLEGANLRGAHLLYANLVGANLSGANLVGANLSGANLVGANLSGANLGDANLSGANLIGAKVTQEQLDRAKSLKGAIMPYGTAHP